MLSIMDSVDEFKTASLPESLLDINAARTSGSGSLKRGSSIGSCNSKLPSLEHSTRHSQALQSSNDKNENPEGTTKTLFDYTAREKATLLCLAFSNMSALMGFSILGPFFPSELNIRGVSSSIGGWIFGVYGLVYCVTSPLFGRLVSIVGIKFQFIAGGFVSGCCCLVFGSLYMVPYDAVFVVLCFVVRIFMAVGGTACAIATFALTTHVFRDSAASALSLLEIGSGLGLMLGPAFGGILYDHFGFKGPFVVLGVLMILPLPIYCVVVKSPKDNGPHIASHGLLLWKVLSMPSVIFITLTILVASITVIIIDPTLASHLQQDLDFNPSQVGLSFLVSAVIYTILVPFVGRIADFMPNNTPLIAFGFIFSTLGMFFLGPSPYSGLKDYKTVWLNMLSLLVLGIGGAFTIVPTYNKLLEISSKAGLGQSQALHAVVASIWNASFSFGQFIGPVLGGWLLNQVGFEYCMTGVSLTCGMLLLMTLIFWYLENKKENQNYKNPDDNEKSRLLT